ncbi:porphobilinogen synthase [Helicobacter cappadocius]|uniref:Delta-aminolevulinic acid dehydratase n=1 Tax=Helicobacter cappadocius TaxID=3063998 RepID=A0AA90PJJ3_9HELI|nr:MULTISPECIES: porphobilinogen synthase [unclassified Helicobacter]MDO7253800.1 porphobilinogen synthase [Helicobacter sp. faydin-H75]MDP2538680.1 porphobilinogen synthase [Helicobacter sp. faydin-H76]
MFRRLRRLRLKEGLRDLVRETRLDIRDFIYPLFVVEGEGIKNEISSMPDVYQMSCDNILKECEELQKLGIHHILLFGIPSHKDSCGSEALSDQGIVAKTIRAVKSKYPQMIVTADLCFCEYTDHGHCGIIDPHLKSVDNDATLEILGQQAIVLCNSGADIIAPSTMMDGMVIHIRTSLDKTGFSHIPIMSYSTKFASAYYGPFRDVAQSAPSFGDRKSYQEDPANRREAILESLNDEAEGADILMVKPALAYLDIIRDVRERTLLPLAIYNVSGEYAILKAAQKAGVIDYEKTMVETMIAFKRAGADIIISYHAKEIANYLSKN